MISPSLSFDEEPHVAELVPEERITRSKAKELARKAQAMIMEEEHGGAETRSFYNILIHTSKEDKSMS
ncbi:unnamed protein product [Cochlearia groenlandica]